MRGGRVRFNASVAGGLWADGAAQADMGPGAAANKAAELMRHTWFRAMILHALFVRRHMLTGGPLPRPRRRAEAGPTAQNCERGPNVASLRGADYGMRLLEATEGADRKVADFLLGPVRHAPSIGSPNGGRVGEGVPPTRVSVWRRWRSAHPGKGRGRP
ncbi:hypothetical protein CGC20_16460 [Leishmania donovani]|uniref:Uncharacterized protein n=1 Tax=Leishmania donovani TaxID=5661 RepID=A0A504Y6W2_LEIDO|nr:hypothetical protein CGC20_16460 [Leishmania donovani]